MPKSHQCATAKERIEDGRSRRRTVGRQTLAELTPKERKFDPIHVLQTAGAVRVRQLLPVKYARMKTSPFAFFRGAVSIMAADLARLPNTGIHVQLCGDAHVQNFGSFAAPDGKLVFDLNDFDETIPGPWEWDVKRMASSIVLAGRESGHRDSACAEAVHGFVETYRRFMGVFSRQPLLEAARHQVNREERVQPVHAALRQSERARPLDLLERFTKPDAHGRPRFLDKRPLFWRIHQQAARRVLDAIPEYRNSLAPERRHLFDFFRSVDVGFKVVGTGSVGLRDYVVLFEGNGVKDPLFLQVKQEVDSAYASYLPGGADHHHGRRVVDGQRALQPLSDPLLGWTSIGSQQYLVRQLNDHKGSIDLQLLKGRGLSSLATLTGELLARGHARSGDACRIFGYCGSGAKISDAIGKFALRYAVQTEADYESFVDAIKAGRIPCAA